MQETSLFWIEPPNEQRSALVVGREILSLYRQDYQLTTWDLCRLLRCERRWVQDTLRPGIRHICVSHYFRQYLVEQFSLEEEEQEAFRYASYFYSRESAEAYWKTHGTATQKTRMIDLADYLDRGAGLSALLEEQERHQHSRRSGAETKRHLSRMEELLTPDGYRCYEASRQGKAPWKAVALPRLPLDKGMEPLCTKADIRKRYGLKTDTSALQWLVRHGAVRIQLEGKTLWSVTPGLYRVPLAVPLDSL